MPTTTERPMLDATHPAMKPKKHTRTYEAAKLPFDAAKSESEE